MRYIDSGADDPAQTLGHWLTQTLLVPVVTELRWQTGYFDADGLGPMLPVLASASLVRVLIGSNDGQTQASDVRCLLAWLGAPRINISVGIASYTGGLFHPKVFHVVRNDGSQAAYVGSANLTAAGVSSRNIEAGVTLDSREDPVAVLGDIAAKINRWFATPVPPGFSLVRQDGDVQGLVASGVLATAPPPPREQTPPAAPGATGAAARPGRHVVFAIPRVPRGPAAVPVPPPTPPAAVPHPIQTPHAVVAKWSKQLSPSDAQRKPTGNQRGAITLVKAGYMIHAQTYFRRDFFSSATWSRGVTRTGQQRETAIVQFDVDVLGKPVGRLDLTITHAPNREASQANYTSELHLGPLQDTFSATNMSDKWLLLTRLADGSYTLSVLDKAP